MNPRSGYPAADKPANPRPTEKPDAPLRSERSSVAALTFALFVAVGCEVAEAEDPLPELPAEGATAPLPARDPVLLPLPVAALVDPRRASLGSKIFRDASLSSDGTVSCALCHPLERAGADGLSHSRGAKGKETALNTPTIYNAAHNFRFNWNGAYKTLEDEFDAPVVKTMDTTWDNIDAKLRVDPATAAGFSAAYPDGVVTANVKDALARYIETLDTPNARFDDFLRGDRDALSALERRGYDNFTELGCSSCHQGRNIGGNVFQRIGVMHDYFREREERGGAPITAGDMGLYNSTKVQADRHVFRVPSLRNVALTPPYFHDGSTATLQQAVRTMGRVQLGLALTEDQVDSLVAFLKTLTGVSAGMNVR